ncbi:MAG TPA: hypothetical protein VGO40_15170 [Longimicrobium sp.]|nr:hypothetical protein [Longimicrobium sp.]
MPEPGEVFYLPPERGEAPGKGDRPHLLLSLCPAESEVATFAYGSTQSTDAYRGAEHVLVDPDATAVRGTGLTRPTYVYTSRLVSYARDSIGVSAGRLIDEMPRVRVSLRRALGLGTGVTGEPNVPGSVRRGRFVELSADLAEDWDARYGLVVTAPGYSRSGFQQTIVPLLDEDCETRELDVFIADGRWLVGLGPGYHSAILAVPMVSTVYQPEHIRRYLDPVALPGLMLEIEAALIQHFGL